ncbi:MAG: hemerythrin domain-containing protein [Rubrivivax sp.]|nr:hemerythrin domain-containing protein [Rubrivivax sp.]
MKPLFPTPGAGYDQPFEMLGACHDRVRRSLDLLQRLQAHLIEHGADAQARDAARDVLRYFDLAAPKHHADEEIHVFPALLAADAAAHGTLIERLQDEHRRMEAAWPAARLQLQAVADGRWQVDGADAAAAAWACFAGLYDAHMAAEDQIVYPAARSLFDAAALATMGGEMAARRGLTAVNTGP